MGPGRRYRFVAQRAMSILVGVGVIAKEAAVVLALPTWYIISCVRQKIDGRVVW